MAQKSYWPAYRWAHHPKAGQNTEHRNINILSIFGPDHSDLKLNKFGPNDIYKMEDTTYKASYQNVSWTDWKTVHGQLKNNNTERIQIPH